jgi:hypothetical protein
MPWKKGTNKYIAQVRRNGQRREKVFRTLKDAKAYEAKLRKMSEEEWNGKTSTVSLIDWATKYLDYAKTRFSEKTYHEKKGVFKRLFKSVDPATPVEKLTSGRIRRK